MHLRLLFGKWLVSVRGGAGWPEPFKYLSKFSSSTNMNTTVNENKKKKKMKAFFPEILWQGYTLLFRLFRFDFDRRLVGGSLCPVCPERTDSLSIFTQLRNKIIIKIMTIICGNNK